MRLELNSKEVEAVLLEYTQAKWPGLFNAARCSDYQSIPDIVFTHEDKADKKE